MFTPEFNATEANPASLLQSIVICQVCRSPLEFNSSGINQKTTYICPQHHVAQSVQLVNRFVSEVCIALIERPENDELQLSNTGVFNIGSWWDSAPITAWRMIIETLLVPMITPTGDIDFDFR